MEYNQPTKEHNPTKNLHKTTKKAPHNKKQTQIHKSRNLSSFSLY